MEFRMLRWIVPVVFAAAATPATAEIDGNKLLRFCEKPKDTPDYAFCVGFITGTTLSADYTSMTAALAAGINLDDERAFRGYHAMVVGNCQAKDMTPQQAVDVTTLYLKQNPNERHYPAAGLTLTALEKAFPCPSR
ncbi:Rap1a/Tai family immunity protein [Paracoccus denitrificans]|jgi:hypothetical protein